MKPSPFRRQRESGWHKLHLAFLLIAGVMAAWLAPAALGREVRVATYDIGDESVATNSAKYSAIQAVLARVNADIVCFQFLRADSFAAWSNLIVELGYPYSAVGGNGPFSGELVNGYFSRFPILSTFNVTSPTGAVEFSRLPFRATFDVPDTDRPLVIWNMHHKQGYLPIDLFRRAIEAQRIARDIDAYLAANPDHGEYVLVGSMGDDIRSTQPRDEFEWRQPTGAPEGYILGSDIVFPVAYSIFPTDRYADAGNGLQRLAADWEGTNRPVTRPSSDDLFDYVFVSPAIATNPLGAPAGEVYYSAMDLGGGLAKQGDPLPPETSTNASSHLPIFVDIHMANRSLAQPPTGLVSIGEEGGPFDPDHKTYTITVTNGLITSWTAETDVAWLALDAESFDVQPSVPYPVTVSLNGEAAALPPGEYAGTVTFRNLTLGVDEVRTVTLTIRDQLDVSPTNGFSSSGTVGGPFSPASAIYVLTNKSATSIGFTASSTPNWITPSPASGTLAGNSSAEVTLNLNGNANDLAYGLYADTVTFSNQVSGLLHVRPIGLAANGGLCDAVDRCDLPWTTGGDAVWYYQTNATVDGVDAARCGTITTNQQTWMETAVTGPMQIHFYWQVSSRGTHLLRFLDNGTVKRKIGGDVTWTNDAYQIGTGVHTLRWDYVTTEFVPQGSNAAWVDQIALDNFLVDPTNTWGSGGISGGPFTNATCQYVLTNSGASTLRWNATPATNWISASPDSGELAAHGSTAVELSLNTNAYDLRPGTRESLVTFANLTTEHSVDRPISLVVRSPLTLTPILAALPFTGFTGGPYSPPVQTMSISNISMRNCSWATLLTNWVTLEPSSGTLAPGASLTISVSINTNADALPPGQIFAELSTSIPPAQALPYCTASLNLQASLALVSAPSWVPSGPSSGPFSPTSQVYVLTNRNSTAQHWAASTTADWLSFDLAAGDIAATSSVAIIASVNPNAAALPIGNYTHAVVFSDPLNGFAITQTVMLAVGTPFCESIEACNLNWTFGGNSLWFAQTNVTKDGVDAARSGAVTNWQHSWMQTTVTGPRLLDFYWRTASTTPNYLRFQVDGVNRTNLSGNTPWVAHSYEIPSGVHTLRWVFTNSLTATGTNAGWVDLVTLDGLYVTPTNIWSASGPSGGPFSPSSRSYVLTNSGSTTLQWTALPNASWISVSPSGGDLAAGQGTTVVLSLNTNARTLFSGSYTNPVVFSNRTSGRTLSRVAVLSVKDSLFVSSTSITSTGFIGGPYSPPSHVIALSNSAATSIDWSASSFWVALTPTNGTLGPAGTASVAVTFSTNVNALRAGTNVTTITFNNTTMRRSRFISVVLNVQEALLLPPEGSWFSSGPVGGPFEPPATAYTLTNQSDSTQYWSTSNSATWFSLEPTNGAIPAHSTLPITASLSPPATALPRGTYFTRIVISNQLNKLSTTQSVFLAVGCAFCDAPDACHLDWTLGGTRPWLFQTNVTQDGVDAAASGVLTNYQDSWMQTTVTGPGTLSFWWKVSSMTNSGNLSFYVGSRQTNRISGLVDWQAQSYSLTSGVHVLRWMYSEGFSPQTNSSRGWVDLVAWIPTCTTSGVPIGWYQQFSLAPATNGTWDDLDTNSAASGTPYWFQYVAGLNPTNSRDSFRILDVRQEDGQPLQIEWWGGTNGPVNPYIIQSTPVLKPATWEAIGTSPRTAGVNVWTNAAPADDLYFYRILAEPDPVP